MIEPLSVESHTIGDGVHKLYRFDNGYGASVVQFMVGPMGGSYGAADGLWELGVIRWSGEKYQLTYETPLTDDVIGFEGSRFRLIVTSLDEETQR